MNREVIGILGSSGSGKTALAKLLWRTAQRGIVSDTLTEYEDGAVFNPPDNREAFLSYLAQQQTGNFRIIHRPGLGAQRLADFDLAARAAYIVGNCALFIEEIDFYSDSHGSEEVLDLIIRYGRKRALNLVWTARVPKAVHNELRNETRKRIVFPLLDETPIEAIAPWLGWEYAERLRSLPPLTGFYWHPPNPVRLLRIAPDRESFTLEPA